MKILVTGTAGFIGFHLAQKLLDNGNEIIGLDNINDYYDVRLKLGRLKETGIEEDKIEYGKLIKSNKYEAYQFIKLNLEDNKNIFKLFKTEKFDVVVNLAAQAGVRYSLTNPQAYINSNITGFLNILEASRYYPVKHLVYASSSSVYGLNTQMPFSVCNNADHPISLYATSKKCCELMAHTYSHLFNIPTTGLRFFTAYGPWGRPDMALFIFTRSILEGKPIQVFNNGQMQRDFTYIDDVIEGINKIIEKPAQPNEYWNGNNPNPCSSTAPYRLYNIGNSSPVKLMDFVKTLENALGKKAIINYQPMQPGDVIATWADVEDLKKDFNYQPNTTIKKGIEKFVEWYKEFYKR